jgi:hypothetical protein
MGPGMTQTLQKKLLKTLLGLRLEDFGLAYFSALNNCPIPQKAFQTAKTWLRGITERSSK